MKVAIIRVAIVVTLLVIGRGIVSSQTLTPGVNMYPFGINWMDTRSVYNTSSPLYPQFLHANFNYNLPHLFDSLGFNTYHEVYCHVYGSFIPFESLSV